jgi:uncharacterized membrane protein
LALAALLGAWRLQRDDRGRGGLALGALRLGQLSHVLLRGAAWWVLTALCEISLRALGPARARGAVGRRTQRGAVERHRPPHAMARPGTALPGPGAGRRAGLAECLAFGLPAAAELGWLGWGALLLVHLWSLRYLQALLPSRPLRGAHVLGCWVLLTVLALQLRYLFLSLAEHYNAWRWLGWALLPSAYLMVMGARLRSALAGGRLPREYRALAAAPVAVALLAWFWLVNLFSDGAADPLPYLPLLNPLELGMLIVLAAILQWTRSGLPLLGPDTGAVAPAGAGRARRLAVRPADPGGVPHRAPLGGGALRAGFATGLDGGAGRALAGLDPDRPGADDRRPPAPPPRPVDGRRGADRRGGGQAVLRRTGQQRQPGAHHFLHRRWRAAARRRLLRPLPPRRPEQEQSQA